MCSLNDLGDDLLLLILSYISILPHEESTLVTKSNLTHVFPLVNKRFYTLCSKTDYLWKLGIERLIRVEPDVWAKPLSRRLSSLRDGTIDSSPTSALVQQHHRSRLTSLVPSVATNQGINHHRIFIETLLNDVLYTLPYLYDTTNQELPHSGIQIGEEIDIYIHLREHQAFISTLMKAFATANESYKNGDEIIPEDQDSVAFGVGNRDQNAMGNNNNAPHTFPTCPTFVYLNDSVENFSQEHASHATSQYTPSSSSGSTAATEIDRSPLSTVGRIAPKVQVRECLIYPDNSAHLRLMPISYVRLQNVKERLRVTDDVAIYDAKVCPFNKQETTEWIVTQHNTAAWKRWKKIFFVSLSFLVSSVRATPRFVWWATTETLWTIICLVVIIIQWILREIFDIKNRVVKKVILPPAEKI